MNKLFLIAALAAGSAAVSSPASGMRLCVESGSRLYAFLDESSRQIQSAHGPEGEGLAHLVEATIAESVLKGAAANRFHIPTCPTALQRAIQALPVSAEEIDRYLKEP